MSWNVFYIAAGHALPAIAVGASTNSKLGVVAVGVVSAIVGVLFGNPHYAAYDVVGAIIGAIVGFNLAKTK